MSHDHITDPQIIRGFLNMYANSDAAFADRDAAGDLHDVTRYPDVRLRRSQTCIVECLYGELEFRLSDS